MLGFPRGKGVVVRGGGAEIQRGVIDSVDASLFAPASEFPYKSPADSSAKGWRAGIIMIDSGRTRPDPMVGPAR